MNTYTWNDLNIDMTESFTFEVTEEKMQQFLILTGDESPIHINTQFAKKRGHKGRVMYGMLGASLFSTLAGVYLPGANCLLHSVQAKFAKPVYIGDTLTVSGKIHEKNDTFREITIKAVITNQSGARVTRGIIKAGIEED